MTTHPDANVLAAYAEQRLARKERHQVLGHLADCDRCRRIALMAASTDDGADMQRITRAWEWRLPEGCLRWGPLVAAVGCGLIVGYCLRSPLFTGAAEPRAKDSPPAAAWARPAIMPVRTLDSIGDLNLPVPIRAELPALEATSLGIDFDSSMNRGIIHESALVCVTRSGDETGLTRCVLTQTQSRRVPLPVKLRPGGSTTTSFTWRGKPRDTPSY